jgi:hypothetical protein
LSKQPEGGEIEDPPYREKHYPYHNASLNFWKTDKFGIVTLNLHLYFSVLYKAGTLSQKTFGFHSVFLFNVTKVQMQDWIVQWTSWHAQSEDLHGLAPKNVLDDCVEATSTFNINAFRASSVMARRALQQALEDKGATKGFNLAGQIDELKRKGLLL